MKSNNNKSKSESVYYVLFVVGAVIHAIKPRNPKGWQEIVARAIKDKTIPIELHANGLLRNNKLMTDIQFLSSKKERVTKYRKYIKGDIKVIKSKYCMVVPSLDLARSRKKIDKLYLNFKCWLHEVTNEKINNYKTNKKQESNIKYNCIFTI